MARGGERAWLTIGALSRATGIPAATLRTWERRYGVPGSTRKPSGHRLYAQQVVPHLLDVRRALALGHRPAEILGLPPIAVSSLTAVAPARPAFGSTAAAEPIAARAAGAEDADLGGDLLTIAASFDREEMGARLRALWAELGSVRFLDQCAEPWVRRLAEARLEGEIGLRHEQFASALLADTLRDLRRSYEGRASGPSVAATTFPGDQQEIGLLMESLVAATRGWRVVYLGPGVPSEELALLAAEVPLEAVLVDVSPRAPQAYAFALVLELRRRLPERVSLWIGGRGPAVLVRGVLHFGDCAALDRHIAGLAVASRSFA